MRWAILVVLGAAACSGSPERQAQPQPESSSVRDRDQSEPSKTEPGPAERAALTEHARYFPQKIGRQWVLAIVVEQANKTLVSAKHRIEIAGQKTIAGKEYRVYSFCTEYDGQNQREVRGERYHRLDETGFYLRHEGMSQELQAVRFPLRIGDTWACTTKDKAQSFLVEGLADLTIAGETYRDCLVVSTQISSDIEEHNKRITTYFARDIGRIKEVVEFRAGFTQVAELISFQ